MLNDGASSPLPLHTLISIIFCVSRYRVLHTDGLHGLPANYTSIVVVPCHLVLCMFPPRKKGGLRGMMGRALGVGCLSATPAPPYTHLISPRLAIYENLGSEEWFSVGLDVSRSRRLGVQVGVQICVRYQSVLLASGVCMCLVCMGEPPAPDSSYYAGETRRAGKVCHIS